MRKWLTSVVTGLARGSIATATMAMLMAVAPVSSADAYVLITDIDDTVKVTHVRDPIDRVVRFLTDASDFAGMAELYQRLLYRQPGAEFAVVSGAPRVIEFSIRVFLFWFGFPEPNQIWTRTDWTSVDQYKKETIRRILNARPRSQERIVMIGDDTEQDPEVYLDISQNHPIQSSVYIRRVADRAVDERVRLFDSAVDIAVLEYLEGRLMRRDVFDVAVYVRSESAPDKLFVPGEHCPGDRSPRVSERPDVQVLDGELLGELRRVEDHLRESCRRR